MVCGVRDLDVEPLLRPVLHGDSYCQKLQQAIKTGVRKGYPSLSYSTHLHGVANSVRVDEGSKVGVMRMQVGLSHHGCRGGAEGHTLWQEARCRQGEAWKGGGVSS